MDIIEPVPLGDVAFTRASSGTYFDRDGVLQSAAANVLRVTYDPADLGAAPYPLIEAAATNYIRNNSMQGATLGSVASGTARPNYWFGGNGAGGDVTAEITEIGSKNGIDYFRLKINGTATGTSSVYLRPETYNAIPAAAGEVWAASFFVETVRSTGVSKAAVAMYESNASNQPTQTSAILIDYDLSKQPLGAYRPSTIATLGLADTVCMFSQFYVLLKIGEYADAEFLIGMPQIERDRVTSVIRTTSAAVTRAADVVGSGQGMVYCNTPIDVETYSATTTYAKDALVYDPVGHNVYQSLIASNLGKALADTTAWTPRGAVNRWAMLDQYNNTQTSNAEEIIVVLSPQVISQGFYVGNVDAAEVRVSVVDLYSGLVYQEVQNLNISTSGSSFFNWGFKRKRRRTWAVSLKLPPYANALVTVTFKKPGGMAKCGMCVVGPTMDLGRTLMTLGAEIRDFSDTSFNFDGTSTTVLRNWAKRISADVVVDADRVDDVYEFMASYRQRPLVWVGSLKYGLAIAFGRYSGIKPVVKGASRWDMSMQIEGTV